MQDLQNQSSQIDRVFAKPGFGKDAARALGITDELSNSDLTILLTYLARDRPSLVYDGAVSSTIMHSFWTNETGRL